MKLWIDDVRPAPDGYVWLKSVNEAKRFLLEEAIHLEEISLDHDAGEYAADGGDYINLLNWMEHIQALDIFYYGFVIFKIHSMNPVGIENMKRIIEKNGWRFRR